jgi:hypothetical protein
MIVPSTPASIALRPANVYLANPYPANVARHAAPAALVTEYSSVLPSQRRYSPFP